MLSGYFNAMSGAITSHHAQVTRYVGDGLMALFGALDENPWQTRDAVLLALALREARAAYNKTLRAKSLPSLAVGIGIHRGGGVTGVIGAEELTQFGVYGDAVNVASRVESLTRVFDTDPLITDDVHQV